MLVGVRIKAVTLNIWHGPAKNVCFEYGLKMLAFFFEEEVRVREAALAVKI